MVFSTLRYVTKQAGIFSFIFLSYYNVSQVEISFTFFLPL